MLKGSCPAAGLSVAFLPDGWFFGSILLCHVTLLWEQDCEGDLFREDIELSPCPTEHFDLSRTFPFALSHSRIFGQYPS